MNRRRSAVTVGAMAVAYPLGWCLGRAIFYACNFKIGGRSLL